MPFYSFDIRGKLPANKYISEDQANQIDSWFRGFFEKLGMTEIKTDHCETVNTEGESIDAEST